MIYNIEFIGRKVGAIGVTYKVNDRVEAENEADFIEKLYKKYNTISMLKINGKLKNKIQGGV